MIRRLMPIWPPEVGTNTSLRISYTYEEKKQKSHDNFRLEKNCMQLFVIRNRIRTTFCLISSSTDINLPLFEIF